MHLSFHADNSVIIIQKIQTLSKIAELHSQFQQYTV